MLKKHNLLLLSFLFLSLLGAYFFHRLRTQSPLPITPSQTLFNTSPLPTPTPSPSPSPTMTPAERQAKYGPCVSFPVLMYHHVNTAEEAKAGNYTYLNVTPETFAQHLAYLNTRGYTSISPQELINFFAGTSTLPAKPILLTFDDGYRDLAENAFPLLSRYQVKATVFLPTGLMDNPNYLTWQQLKEASLTGLVTFGNHTWSHHSAFGDLETIAREITTADIQLADRGYNSDKIFAYPYGSSSQNSVEVLKSLDYQLAFTTTPGTWQCKGLKYYLPRLRIGNTTLSYYGL